MTTKTNTIDNFQGADLIDLREVTERVEELRTERDAADPAWTEDRDEAQELKILESLLDDCRGNGGDHQWEGAWYPITMIADSYFQTYAEELADDIGVVVKDARWPNNHIDWEAAADELKGDYTSIDFAGTEYWVR